MYEPQGRFALLFWGCLCGRRVCFRRMGCRAGLQGSPVPGLQGVAPESARDELQGRLPGAAMQAIPTAAATDPDARREELVPVPNNGKGALGRPGVSGV